MKSMARDIVSVIFVGMLMASSASVMVSIGTQSVDFKPMNNERMTEIRGEQDSPMNSRERRIWCQWRNRVERRLARLRDPKRLLRRWLTMPAELRERVEEEFREHANWRRRRWMLASVAVVSIALLQAHLTELIPIVGFIGAMSSLPSDDDDPRDLLRRTLRDLDQRGLAGAVDGMTDKEIDFLLGRFGVMQLSRDAVEGIEQEEARLLESEIRDEHTRRHGAMVEGEDPYLSERMELIHRIIERLDIREALLERAECPIEEEREARLNEAVKILAKLTIRRGRALTWDGVYDSVIAIGDPQMGKTATFLLFCILSAVLSNHILPPLNLVVIVSGRPKEPRTQTLDAANALNRWNTHVEFEVISDELTDIKRKNVDFHARKIVRAWNNERTPVIVVKKDSKVLASTLHLLDHDRVQQEAESRWGGLRGLFIQDEADEAAVPQRRGSTMATHDEGIHGLVSSIRETLGGPYVGFTATENALLLMDRESSIFPRRLVMLTPGREYVGPEFWMLLTPDCMRGAADDIQQPLDAATVRNWGVGITPRSVIRFVTDHVVATATRRLDRPDCVSKALANLSNRKDVQEEFGIVIQLVLRQLGAELRTYVGTGSFSAPEIRAEFFDSFYRQIDRLEWFDIKVASFDGLDNDEKKDMVAEASIAVIDSLRPYILNEETEDTWDEDIDDVIVIAGNKAGRAVVFKGLTVQYMPLDPINFLEDTNIQRLRCCGYRYREWDLPFMCLTMRTSIKDLFVKIVRMRVLRRTSMREIDGSNLDLSVTPIVMHNPIRSSATGLSRSGKSERVDHPLTATTRLVRDSIPISDTDGSLTIPERSDLMAELAGMLYHLKNNSESRGVAEPSELGRGVVFYGVDLAILPLLATLCSDKAAIPYLELTRDSHEQEGGSVNVVFRINPNGPEEDRFPNEVMNALGECGWQDERPAYMLRRSCEDSEGEPCVEEGCITVKQLVGSYMHKGHDHEYLGHDHTLDGQGKEGSKTGVRERGDPSVVVFGVYRVLVGHASSADSRLLGPGNPVLLSARTPDHIALSQRAVRNASVEENAEARRTAGFDGGEEE